MKSSELLKSFAPHLIALGAFLALSFIYCSPVLKGYQLSSNDITQFKGAAREYLDYKEKTGEKTHWTNTMFSGMPGYQITGGWEMDLIGVKNLKWLMSKALPKPVNAIFLPMLGFYILLLVLKLDPLKAGIGAIAYHKQYDYKY